MTKLTRRASRTKRIPIAFDASEILCIAPEQRTYAQNCQLFANGYYVTGMSKLDTRNYRDIGVNKEGYVEPDLGPTVGVSGHTKLVLSREANNRIKSIQLRLLRAVSA